MTSESSTYLQNVQWSLQWNLTRSIFPTWNFDDAARRTAFCAPCVKHPETFFTQVDSNQIWFPFEYKKIIFLYQCLSTVEEIEMHQPKYFTTFFKNKINFQIEFSLKNIHLAVDKCLFQKLILKMYIISATMMYFWDCITYPFIFFHPDFSTKLVFMDWVWLSLHTLLIVFFEYLALICCSFLLYNVSYWKWCI